MRRLWTGGIRALAPWAVAGLIAWFLVSQWVPASACRFRTLHARTEHLRTVAPGPEELRGRVRSAVLDSSARADLRAIATRRQAHGSDPSSQVAALVVPRLESEGVRLQKVSAREESGEVLLSLSIQASWADLVDGLASLDSIPFAWTTRRLSLRPADNFRLVGDLVLGVPSAPQDTTAVAP